MIRTNTLLLIAGRQAELDPASKQQAIFRKSEVGVFHTDLHIAKTIRGLFFMGVEKRVGRLHFKTQPGREGVFRFEANRMTISPRLVGEEIV